MTEKVIEYLEKLGYSVNKKPYDIIRTCEAWYMNEDIEGFHNKNTVQGNSYTLEKTNIAKRCCSDDANLCEVLSINLNDKKELIDGFLKDNSFSVKLREQLELLSATGTVGAYLRVVNAEKKEDGSLERGELEICYVKAHQIYPLKIKNGKIIDCAFAGSEKDSYVIVIFNKESERYKVTVQYFKKDWTKKESYNLYYPTDCKPFSILKTSGANNIEELDGFGIAKIYNAISYLKGVDLAWNTFLRDLEKADKLVLMNEKMLKFDDSGKPLPPSKSAKELFCFLGEKLPEEKSLIQEYNPSIRVDEITKAMEFSLSMLSNMFGYGTRKYSFENGQIKTATEYIGERQDLMQELNKQRDSVKAYIMEIIRGAMVLYNAMYGFNIDVEQEILIDFDDSYVNDRQSQMEAMRADLELLGLVPLQIRYLVMRYGITEDEAKSWIEGKEVEDRDLSEV